MWEEREGSSSMDAQRGLEIRSPPPKRTEWRGGRELEAATRDEWGAWGPGRGERGGA